MPAPILTIGELEPERPTVRIHHVEPDGTWQRLKDRYLEVLVRWWPVRYTRRSDLYALRHPSEFGVRDIARIANAQRVIADLDENVNDSAQVRRVERTLREVAGLVLDAPAAVLDRLTPTQHIQVLMAFNVSAMGQTPTQTPNQPTENPSTSADSSPASAGSTPVSAGSSG